MSLKTIGLMAAVLLSLGGSQAFAQSDPFYADKLDPAEAEGEEPTSTLFQGSLTSTSVVSSEFGGTPQGVQNLDNYSPASRLFTDLRAQLDARHVSGGTWDMRLDGRVRVNSDCTLASYAASQANGKENPDLLYPRCRNQSGTFGGNEYDVREFYARRAGQSSDFYLGRQFVPELAALKIDGVKYQYHLSDRWSVAAAGGLHPARGSRSIATDYPFQQLDGGVQDSRIMPVAAGLGSSYRYQSIYGNVGAAGILPLANDRYDPNVAEPVRVFVTEGGYWRQSSKLDLYHLAVVDLAGANGAALTNLSLGINYVPTSSMHVTLGVNQVDTETLNAVAQNYLADADAEQSAQPSNEQQVLRIASRSARLGVSVSLAQQRYEISTSAQVRQRPDITLYGTDGVTQVLIPAAQAAEVMVRAVDRRSVMGWRLGLGVSRIFGLGENLNRSQATIAGIDGSRSFARGKGQVDANLNFIAGTDDNRDVVCNNTNVLDCYGTASVVSVAAGSTIFYRLGSDWFAMGSASVGRQGFSSYIGGAETAQPANYLVTGFARLGYRF